MTRQDRIAELQSWRPKLLEYCRLKLEQQDFHGVADAAMDLRDLDAEMDGLLTEDAA